MLFEASWLNQAIAIGGGKFLCHAANVLVIDAREKTFASIRPEKSDQHVAQASS
jgi:hypothetical protein